MLITPGQLWPKNIKWKNSRKKQFINYKLPAIRSSVTLVMWYPSWLSADCLCVSVYIQITFMLTMASKYKGSDTGNSLNVLPLSEKVEVII